MSFGKKLRKFGRIAGGQYNNSDTFHLVSSKNPSSNLVGWHISFERKIRHDELAN